MCGFVGAVGRRTLEPDWQEALTKANNSLSHRGPDGGRVERIHDPDGLLGHRRLSVIDLSIAAFQPMYDPVTGSALLFNGEIYSFPLLRKRLIDRGESFLTDGDSEVLLRSLRVFGLEGTLRDIDAMYSFAFVDRPNHRVVLARDRFGEKPLYWRRRNGVLTFASELRALRLLPGFDSSPNHEAAIELLRFETINPPRTIHPETWQLRPGTALLFPIEGDEPGPPTEVVHWDAAEEAATAARAPFDGSEDEAVTQLDAVLGASVNRRTISDVPLGAFLSGGIDSSLTVALLQRFSTEPVKTFTIGFSGPLDESPNARSIAAHLGTDHVELRLEPREALGVVEQFADLFDEPFTDSSAIPTYLVAGLARKKVTVALSGDGGDEFGGGYVRYRADRRIGRIPPATRRNAATLLQRIPARVLDKTLPRVAFGPLRGLHHRPGDRVHRFASLLGADADERYQSLRSLWPAAALIDGDRARFPVGSATGSSVHDRMLHDTSFYLPNDILTKVDRAAMAQSLETRVPMLEPATFRFMWSLPDDIRIGSNGKRVQKLLLERYIPRPLWDRPKMGFGIPLAEWLRHDLRPLGEDLLSEATAERWGFIRPEFLRAAWLEHQQGTKNNQHLLWAALVLHQWCERWAT